MWDLINSINLTKKYSKIVYPSVNIKINEYKAYADRIKMQSARSRAFEALNKTRHDMAVSSILALHPRVDFELSLDVLFSFQAIIRYLNEICIHFSSSTEPFLNIIFSSLKDALNIRSDAFEKYFTFFPSKDDNGYLSILVEKCRQKVLKLPSFEVIRDYVSAYLSLYIDLQIFKFSCDDPDKEIHLRSWSSAHGQKYSDISNWEFCMSVDSSMTIQLFLALATDPDLSDADIESINNSFFPWIPGSQKILEGYLNYNYPAHIGNQYNFYYKNLKEYENRIIYFTNKAASINNKTSEFYNLLLKLLLSIYITHPKANEGMNKLTSKALARAGGSHMITYINAVKYLRYIKKI